MPPLVVIGAGLAGWTAVREFRKLDTTTPVVLITADSGDFYAKPSLSNALAQKKAPGQLVTTPAAKMAETLGVTLVPFTRVESLDIASRTVRTAGGVHPWSHLVLATGAQPIRVQFQGDAADTVLSVNSLDDFTEFHARLAAGSRVLIMGAGLIGCEFANDLAGAGHKVSVVDPGPRPLAALLPEQAGDSLRLSLESIGVTWHFGTAAQAVDRQGDALRVQLSDGQVQLTDVVLSAVGLRADMRLAQSAGIACDRGILVDTALQTSAPDVYALGDCAQYASAGSRTLPYVMPIMAAARALAATLAGKRTDVQFALMPVSVKTPAYPIVVASPVPGTQGTWHNADEGLWHFVDESLGRRGFVLAGRQTSRRAEMARELTA
ncbi:MAG: FAD-dependent oxidoreductase [Pseudomonadota bacterium]